VARDPSHYARIDSEIPGAKMKMKNLITPKKARINFLVKELRRLPFFAPKKI
jgi:hypothetical protein